MKQVISPTRIANLVGDFDRSPAYAGLAQALMLLIGDGRITTGIQLPSERELTTALGVSRTTVTRAYAELRDAGYAESRRGSGTYTTLPGGASGQQLDRAFTPATHLDEGSIDLNCAASTAPPGVLQAYEAALPELPAYLGNHGYFPGGLPHLQSAIAQTYAELGLATDPEQIIVTPGALAANAIVAHAIIQYGDRVMIESPVYPNAGDAFRSAGARLAPCTVDPQGWDLANVEATLRQTAPKAAYLIPDFQNPTGHLMTSAQRATYAAHLGRAHAIAVADEAHRSINLEDETLPEPFAAHYANTFSIGSASKSIWGGLRIGWIRSPKKHVDAVLRARLALDLGVPVMEQLVLFQLLQRRDEVLDYQRARLRTQRDALLGAITERLPEWSFVRPRGGLSVWCQLPSARATDLCAEAERRGVVVPPGPVFAVEGGLNSFVRIPWTRPVAELETAVERLADAWAAIGNGAGRPRPAGEAARVMVA